LEPGDGVDLAAVALGQRVDERRERGTVGEQWRDVPEQDPGLGEVRNLTDVGVEQLGELLGKVGHRRPFRRLGWAAWPRWVPATVLSSGAAAAWAAGAAATAAVSLAVRRRRRSRTSSVC